MIDLNSKLEIPFIYNNNSKIVYLNQKLIKDPDYNKLPPQIDPDISNIAKNEEPPLTQEDKLNPSNNPIQEKLVEDVYEI